ncbi:MAG: hypothetical protein KAJ60_00180 [Desulfobulbaceae bacterium]|nr:hypothetical protein [Desulfobulbaceae bacterium]MCK5339449.1 hypothetical protein [Desulfobulbaceae bacterium]
MKLFQGVSIREKRKVQAGESGTVMISCFSQFLQGVILLANNALPLLHTLLVDDATNYLPALSISPPF